jgi:hypothetical protein
MVPPFEPTPLEWLMMGDAAEIMAYTGDPSRAQLYFDIAVGCWRNVMPRDAAAE